MELAKYIEAKDVSKAKTLLEAYKAEVKSYLESCKNKDKFEETSIMLHTYEDRLADVEYDLSKKQHSIDCSNVPQSKKLDEAFESKKASEIEVAYKRYKQNAADYLEHCASHAEYEMVYEASMLHDESYDTWKSES